MAVVKTPRLLLPVLAFALAAAATAPAPKSSTPPKTAPKKTAPSTKAPAAKAPATKAPAKQSAARTGSRKRYTPPRPRGQMTPTPDRIRDIQQALVSRGYDTPVDGLWSKDTEAALARFQSEQNLDGAGKLNSLSLIALGLGPKRDSNPEPASPPPQKD